MTERWARSRRRSPALRRPTPGGPRTRRCSTRSARGSGSLRTGRRGARGSHKQIRGFAELDFVSKAKNIVCVGPTGVGKTGLATQVVVGLVLDREGVPKAHSIEA